ncbi:hypothetical protein RKLH11_2975 [Rhodobacteraceae bacterium KLH11]|nr:hypothetical protein RKLH11_2975 [Rhodobacteraceae bacterium KLH11]
MTTPSTFLTDFFALPLGTFTGRAAGRRYSVSRSRFANNRSHKLVAHELGGPDYISLNLYLTRKGGALLRPCEMPADKVIAFVTSLVPDVQE